jgi:UDP-N-acetylglucosamine transferase subunit ALG13
MIFVTIGTSEPFERLLEAACGLVGDEEVVVQRGRSQTDVPGATLLDFLDFEQFELLVEDARVVVTHAGAGSVLVALRHGQRPIVVPRLQRHGEAVDDHQLAFARRLAEVGLVELVDDLAQLPHAVAAHDSVRLPPQGPSPALVEELREYVGAAVRGS